MLGLQNYIEQATANPSILAEFTVMAVISAKPAVEISFASQIIEVNHFGQYNCIQTNASLG